MLDFVEDESLEYLFKNLRIDPELEVSILTKLSGPCANYQDHEVENNFSARQNLVFTKKTTSEEVFLRQLRDKIDLDAFKAKNGINAAATHAVVSIEWGITQIFTCEYRKSDSENMEKAMELVRKKLDMIKDVLEGKENYESQNEDDKFLFYLSTDIMSGKQKLSFQEMMELAKRPQNDLQKGIPILYKMVSLDSVAKMFKKQMTLPLPYYIELDRKTQDSTVRCIKSLEQLRMTLIGVQEALSRGKNFISASSVDEFSNFVEDFCKEEKCFLEKLKEMILRVRKKSTEAASLENLLQHSLGARFSSDAVNSMMSQYENTLDKITEIKFLNNQGISYIGENDQMDVGSSEVVYVMFIDEPLSNEEAVEEEKTRLFFLKLRQTPSEDLGCDSRFFMVDLALRPDLTESDCRWKIFKYKNGQLVSKDALKDEGLNPDRCVIKLHVVDPKKTLPLEKAVVNVRCPNALSLRGTCSGDPVKWSCATCGEVVWYGIQTKTFFCKCGESVPAASLFRCNEVSHGVVFYEYDSDILWPELMNLQPKKDINVLILGETGVGKSTWINGFANYLYFDNLNSAVSSEEVVSVIPSKFTFTNEQGETKDIIIGTEGKNENFTTGQSATQAPVTYPFYIGEQRIQLIDTPGIGDSRGIEQDKKNFDNILSHLTYFDEIHGICILLKPNNARLTVLFRFCIQQLLAHLHKDAAQNIVFCFTNARGNFYRPGDTLPALRKELADRKVDIKATQENMFCFDNEAFRFLACLRNGIQFDEKEVEVFSKSWDVAATETTRLFNHIKTLHPHKVLNTLSVNDARRIIVEMSRPMAEITVVIQKNIQGMEETKMKMEMMDNEVEEFSKDLYFDGYDLEYVQLGYPRTVCTHPDCIEYIPAGKDSLMQTNYKQQCHIHCGLSGVPTETVGDSRLQRCSAMTAGICGSNNHNTNACGHSYQHHMHRTYDLQVVSKQFLSDGVQDKIKEKKDKKAQMEIFMEELNRQIPEYKEEQATVLRISAKYGSFLKNVAMLPYNDALGDYLDMVIDQENQKDKAIRDPALVASLMTSRKAYDEEKRILDDAMGIDTGLQVTNPDEIKLLQNELFQLKHFGQSLKNIFMQIEQNKKKMAQHAYEEVPIPVQKRQRKKKWTGWFNNPITEYGRVIIRSVR